MLTAKLVIRINKHIISLNVTNVLKCRVGHLVGEFESMFLSDLEDGKLPASDLYCGLEGESMGCDFIFPKRFYFSFQ